MILAIGVPLVAVYLSVLWFDYHTGKEAALRRMKSLLTELASHHAAEFDGQFSTVAQVARCTATFLSTLHDLDEVQLYDLLRNTVRDNPRVYGACIAFEPDAFRQGLARFAPYVCRAKDGFRSLNLAEAGYEYASHDWYLIPKLLGAPVWTDPYFDEGGGNILMCTYSVPFKRDGKLAGIATVDISIRDLSREVSRAQIENGYCTIIGPNGVFISHPNEKFVMRETIFSVAEWYERPEIAHLGREMTAGRRGVRRIPDYRTGEPKWVIFAPTPSCGWCFGAVMPEDKVMAPVYDDLRRDSALMLIGLTLTIGIILLTAINITRPISRLAQVVRKVAAGDLDVRVPNAHGRDEIGEFARTFNKMVSDLKTHIEALTRETAAREAVESELRIARNIQASLLPHTFPPFPQRKELDLHAVNVPAKQVAGDFFDFYFINDDQLFITIGDVSGKGVPAALFMAVTRTLLKNLVTSGLGPAEAFNRANEILVEDNEQSMFVTLFAAIYDTRTGRLRFANAGHNPPYIVTAQGVLTPNETTKATGCILGVIPETKCDQREVQLDAGGLLVLYTDGVTEAKSPDGEFYGEKRFEELISRTATETVERFCEITVAALEDFQGDNQHDDITLLLLRRNE